MYRALIVATLVLFGMLTAVALWQHGYLGIFAISFTSFGAAQILADLAISLSLFIVWMWRDAKATGRNAWPWIVGTLLLGSFAPLVYLLTRKPASC